MPELPANASPGPRNFMPSGLPQDLGAFANRLRSSDMALAFVVLGIIVILIVPLPPLLLDLLFAVSIILSVLILMTALFIETPLQFSAFPTVLLIATMLRLALNLASTRLILANGHTGAGAAGHVIEAFGHFVMGGNFVIGIIVFVILLTVNFVVITKGSGRIAEVAARFTLDAMPGKQMAIDADLSAGLIDEKTARERRTTLENESSFFGAMDGASKFVRGDAIAGLMITAINIIGGIIIGMMQHDMTFSAAGKTFTLLTVGDGLVTQIPALIVSTAAGLLVSKAGVAGAADKALAAQLATMPKALGLSAVVMALIGLMPGIPFLPFFGLAAGAGWFAWHISSSQKRETLTEKTLTDDKKPAPTEDNYTEALRVDEVKVELGYAVVSLAEDDTQEKLTAQIRALRRNLAAEIGFLMPSVRLVDNVQIEPNLYIIRIKDIEAGRGTVYPGQFMCLDPSGAPVNLPGQPTIEPSFGLPALWIDGSLREEAQLQGLTVVDASTVIATHLTELIKANVSELLGYVELQKLIRELPKEHSDLVKEIVPAQLSMTTVQRVLQTLLDERVSIRDLGTIMEGIAEAAGFTKSPREIVENVRVRLARQICAQYLGADNLLPIVTLSPGWENAFAEAIVGQGDDRHLAMAPSKVGEFMSTLRERFDAAAREGIAPVLVTSAYVRPYVRSVVERLRRDTPVMAQQEISPRVRLKPFGSL
jgi:flagellar biosynthesis protein FlhA